VPARKVEGPWPDCRSIVNHGSSNPCSRILLRLVAASLLLYLVTSLSSCSNQPSTSPDSLTFLLESNPTNLDPRYATDGQSAHLDGLLFSSLLERDAQMNLHGDLAESWSIPDPLTYVFHLRQGVHFHDGRTITSADVKSTYDFIRDPANRSPKRGAFRLVTSIDAPDPATVIFHLKERTPPSPSI
jgi:peptide/nickel transport system substrate-binding protein